MKCVTEASAALPGDPAVRQIEDAARVIDELDQLSLADAAASLDTLHGQLQSALTDLDGS